MSVAMQEIEEFILQNNDKSSKWIAAQLFLPVGIVERIKRMLFPQERQKQQETERKQETGIRELKTYRQRKSKGYIYELRERRGRESYDAVTKMKQNYKVGEKLKIKQGRSKHVYTVTGVYDYFIVVKRLDRNYKEAVNYVDIFMGEVTIERE